MTAGDDHLGQRRGPQLTSVPEPTSSDDRLVEHEVPDPAGASSTVRLVIGDLFGPLDLRRLAALATDAYHLWVLAALLGSGVTARPTSDALEAAAARVDAEVRLVDVRYPHDLQLSFVVARPGEESSLDEQLIVLTRQVRTSEPRQVLPRQRAYEIVRDAFALPESADDDRVAGGQRFTAADLEVGVRMVLNNALEVLGRLHAVDRTPQGA